MDTVAKPDAPEPKRRRWRWLRYGLRTLLILVTIVCLWLGWFIVQVHKQRRAVAALEKYGAEVDYSAFYTYRPWTNVLPRGLILWLNDVLSSNDVRRVIRVTIQSADLGEDDLVVLADLPYLKYLNLSGPAITDASLEHVKNLKQLRCLKLIDSKVSDAGLRCVSKLENLDGLYLSGTQFTDAGISYLCSLTKIDELYLDGTNVTGACLQDLAAIKSLRVLRLDNTQVCGEGLVHLAQMPKLEMVIMRNTPISDADLPYLQQVPSRVSLWLARTKLTDEAAQQLPNAVDRRAQPAAVPATINGR
jgi:hypothetical protein